MTSAADWGRVVERVEQKWAHNRSQTEDCLFVCWPHLMPCHTHVAIHVIDETIKSFPHLILKKPKLKRWRSMQNFRWTVQTSNDYQFNLLETKKANKEVNARYIFSPQTISDNLEVELYQWTRLFYVGLFLWCFVFFFFLFAKHQLPNQSKKKIVENFFSVCISHVGAVLSEIAESYIFTWQPDWITFIMMNHSSDLISQRHTHLKSRYLTHR